jgi:tetratricopeptide (TPR) repeat protein
MGNGKSARFAALCAGIALIGFTSGVGAEEGPHSVAVLPYAPLFGQVPQSVADKASDQVSSELAASNSGNDFSVAAVAGEKKTGEHKPKEDALAAAKKQIENATELLQKGGNLAGARKFKPALDDLQHGIELFLKNFQGSDDFKALSDAYVQVALAYLKLGNDDAASKALDDLIRIDPERVLAAPAVPKELASRHARQRTAFLQKPRGAIRVDSAPAGARVTIDGRDLGETPLLAQAALPGDHYVRVVKDGVGAAFEKITVAQDEEAVSFTLAEEHASGPLAAVAKSLSHNTVDESVIKNVQKLGTSSKAEYVVFGAIRKNTSNENLDVKSYAVRTSDGALTELADLSFDQEMLGANIEVLKLVNDLTQKVQEQAFAATPGTLTPFDSVKEPRNTSPAIVQLAPATATAAPSTEGTAETPAVAAAQPEATHRRGPVTHVDTPPPEEVKPAAPVEDTGSESVLDALRRRRERQKQQEEAPKEEPKAQPEDESGRATPAPKKAKPAAVAAAEEPSEQTEAGSSEEQSSTDEDTEEQPKPKAKVTPARKKKSSLSQLTPEQLEQMKQAEAAATSNNNAGMAVLWTSVGVVGAAAIAVGAYFLFRPPPAATTATAHISW